MPRPATLYTPALLALATRLAGVPLDPAHAQQVGIVSRTCGSRLDLSLDTDGDGAIRGVGIRAQACAVGQAAAALFAQGAVGVDRPALQAEHDSLEAWLARAPDNPDPPRPDLAVLSAVRDHPGRHEAVLLPWRAALTALPSDPPAR